MFPRFSRRARAGRLHIAAVLLAQLALATACAPGRAPSEEATPTRIEPGPTLTDPLPTTSLYGTPDTPAGYGLGVTMQRQDGNRYAAGIGALPAQPALALALPGEPLWVVGAPIRDGVLWVALVDDGNPETLGVTAFLVAGSQVTPFALAPERLSPGPPLLEVRGEEARLLVAPTPRSGPTTPVVLDQTAGTWAYAMAGRGLLVMQGREPIVPAPLDLVPLPDGRLLTDGTGRLLLLTDPTDRYAHGVLGDSLEAASITLLETAPKPHVAGVIAVPAPSVVEGLAPIWVDWDRDGEHEIVVTQSDAEGGAQIILYDEAGRQLASGPAIGRGNRWRHQLAVAPFGPAGEMELADVLTPHLGGVVEFYRWQGNVLNIVASVPGYTSHVIGSRNLDMAMAGDFDGDGRVELVLPNQELSALGGIRRFDGGAEVAWSLPLPGRLQTNLAAVTLGDGSLALGLGVEGETLVIWQR